MKYKNKILILGIGSAQTDMIRHCKELGMIVFACARDAIGPGKDLADDFKLIDIKDIDGVESYAIEKDIDFIYSAGSEVSILTSNVVSERLGLPHFMSSEIAKVCEKKNDWRAYLGSEVEGNISFMTIKEEKDINDWNKFPSILKPVDSSGQRGVFLISGKEDFYEYYEQCLQYSNSNEVIIEEYIDGPEISVNAYIVDGNIEFYLISDRISFDEYPGGIIKEHIVPSLIVDEGTEEKIIKLVKDVIDKMEIANGPIYFQIKISENAPKLVEFTPRLDGCHMWRIIKEYTGVDLIEMSVEHLVKGTTNLDNSKASKDNKVYKLKFLCEQPNKQLDKSKYEVEDVIYLEWYYKMGQEIKPLNSYIEKVGYIIYEIK